MIIDVAAVDSSDVEEHTGRNLLPWCPSPILYIVYLIACSDGFLCTRVLFEFSAQWCEKLLMYR